MTARNSHDTIATAGGAATASGMNFQAVVTAIISVSILGGRPLQWFPNTTEDVPIAVNAETAGAGDDLSVELKNGAIIEAQVKKALRADHRLWDSLSALAAGIDSGSINYGVLVVSPDSSRPVKSLLARDIERLGGGRSDGLSDIAKKFAAKLKSNKIPVESTCRCLRIVVVNAIDGDLSSIREAQSHLEHVCHAPSDVGRTWDRLYRDASELIARRGRRTATALGSLLNSIGVKVKADRARTPAALLSLLNQWVLDTNSSFPIFGVKKPLPIESAWIPIKVVKSDASAHSDQSLEEALKRYHARGGDGRSSRLTDFDPEWIGRFVRHSVVVGGPGMGKSTLLIRLARRYAEDGFPVLRVRLPELAARLRQGDSIDEALLTLGLGASGIRPTDVRFDDLSDWILLCDGLDECGDDQEFVAVALACLMSAKPHIRAIVTTRPIGYYTSQFGSWRHYSLMSPSDGSVVEHIANLMDGILADSNMPRAVRVKMVEEQLKISELRDLISRSPLLIALSAALLASGAILGKTKIQLYDRMFRLVEDTPRMRSSKTELSATVLRRTLHLIAWDLVEHPLTSCSACLDRISDKLSLDLGVTVFAARDIAEHAIGYWQDVGLVEKVRHGSDETFTFIHKTFCEFSAARYLESLPLNLQAELISRNLDEDSWAEVIGFAAIAGLADLITVEILNRCQSAREPDRLVARAIDMINEAEVAPTSETLTALVEKAFQFVISERHTQAYRVGRSLVKLSDVFSSHVCPSASKLLYDGQPWTRLIGWACVTSAGGEYLDLELLNEAIVVVPPLIEPRHKRLGGGLILGDDGERETLETFVLKGARSILKNCEAEIADRIIPEVFGNQSMHTMGFHQKASALLEEFGKNYEIEGFSHTRNSLARTFKELPDYDKMRRIAFERMLGSLSSRANEKKLGGSRMVQLGAFFQMSRFWEMPAYDVWTWKTDDHQNAVAEVLMGVVAISRLDPETLRHDIDTFLKELNDASAVRGSGALLGVPSVDVEEPNWPLARDLRLDPEKLEHALYHRSEWLVPLTTNLLSGVVEGDALRSLVERLFDNGRGLTLWAATALSSLMETDVSLSIAHERLAQPIVPGCEHIYEFLESIETGCSPKLLTSLQSGLSCEFVDVACAAAKLLRSVPDCGEDAPRQIAVDAFRHWQEHEEPYPVSGGVIPKSPRADLVMIILSAGQSKIEELFSFTADPRSDVRDAVRPALMDRLKNSETERDSFLDFVISKNGSFELLANALKKKIPFEPSQTRRIVDCLNADDATIRYAVMDILNTEYLSRPRIVELAKPLTRDVELQIRDRAFRAIDHASV